MMNQTEAMNSRNRDTFNFLNESGIWSGISKAGQSAIDELIKIITEP